LLGTLPKFSIIFVKCNTSLFSDSKRYPVLCAEGARPKRHHDRPIKLRIEAGMYKVEVHELDI